MMGRKNALYSMNKCFISWRVRYLPMMLLMCGVIMYWITTQITKSMGPTCGPPGADWTQVGHVLAPYWPHEPCYQGILLHVQNGQHGYIFCYTLRKAYDNYRKRRSLSLYVTPRLFGYDLKPLHIIRRQDIKTRHNVIFRWPNPCY